MKKIIFVNAFLFAIVPLLGQAQAEKQEGVLFSSYEFKNSLYERFTYVINASNDGTLGSFASIDTDENKIKVGATFLSEKSGKYALTVNLEGGNSDNVLRVFNAGNFASNVGASITYHRIIGNDKSRFIQYDLDEFNTVRIKRARIEKEYEDKLDQISSESLINSLRLDSLDFAIKKKVAADSIITLNAMIEGSEELSEILKLEKKLFSYQLNISSYDREISARVDSIKNEKETGIYTLVMGDELITKRSAKLRELEYKLEGFRFNWISIGGGINSSAFKLFDSSEPLNNQLKKASYVTPSIGASFNKYSADATRAQKFTSFGIYWASKDSFDELDKAKIIDRTQTNSNNSTRVSESETTAYVGDYTKRIHELTIRFDTYQFLLNDDKIAIHTFPEYRVKEGRKPIWNFGIGALFTFSEKDEKNSFINAEIFYSLIDLLDVNDSSDNLFKRGEIGVRVAFPINFQQN